MRKIRNKLNFVKVKVQDNVSRFFDNHVSTFLHTHTHTHTHTHRVHYWNGIVYIVAKCRWT